MTVGAAYKDETVWLAYKGPRTVLMKDCPLKSFKENDSFSIKKIVGSTLDYLQKCFSQWTSTYLKIWVENPVFAIQHIENSKKFY